MAELVADFAVQCRLSLMEARKHSLAQLNMMAAASVRMNAKADLAHAQIALVATAVCHCKEGASMYRNLENQLMKTAYGSK